MRLSLALLVASLAAFILLPAGAAFSAPPAAAQNAQDVALATALRTRRLSNVSFQDVKLADAVKWLRVSTGFNFHVKAHALQKAGVDTEALSFTVELDDVTVVTLLKTLFEPYGIFAKVEGNVVWLTSKAEAAGQPVTRLYPISHITYVKYDFIAPDINLRPSDFTPAEEYEPERVVENDPLTDGEAVATLVKETVAVGEWDTEGWSIRATDNYLVVRAPRSVQAEVQKALTVIAALK